MAVPLRILLAFLAVILFLFGLLIAFVVTLDIDHYRDDLVRGVQESTGLNLHLDGPLDLTLFPTLSLEVNSASVSWAQASEAPLAAIRRIHFALPLMPLFTGEEFKIDSVVLDGITLDLRADKSGRNNWTPAGTRVDPPMDHDAPLSGAPDNQVDSPQADNREEGNLELILEHLEVTDLRVRYRDAYDDSEIDLSNVNVEASRTGDGFEVAANGHLHVKEGPQVSFSGKVMGDEKANHIRIQEWVAHIELPGWQDKLSAHFAGEIRHSKNKLTLKDLRLEFGELTLLVRGTASLDETQAMDVHIEIPPSNLRALLARSGNTLTTGDPQALTRLAGQLRISGTPDDLRLAPLTLELDALALTGEFRVRPGERPRVDFDLDAGRLDMRPYSAPNTGAAPPSDSPLMSEAPLNLSALMQTDVQGALTADAIMLEDFESGAVRMEVSSNGDRAHLHATVQELFSGAITADLTLTADSKTPEIALHFSAAGLSGDQLVPLPDFSGIVDIKGRLDASGVSSAALARNLHGRLDLNGSPGMLNVASLQTALLPLAEILGQADRVASWPEQLNYQSLTGTWILPAGGTDQNFNLALDNLQLDGSGDIDPLSGAFDLQLGARFTATPPRTFDLPRELDSVRLPARCTGTLSASSDYSCGFDQRATGELLRQLATGRAGEKLREQLSEKIPESFRETADKLMRGLLSPAQQPTPPPER